MSNWKYCGQFSYMTQAPMAGDGYFDEAEAKRRYNDPDAMLTILPPVDEATGIVPYFIVVTTAEVPAFTVFEQTPPGVIEGEVWFAPVADGRLFARAATIRQFPPADDILVRNNNQALKTVITENREDGTGTLQLHERGSDMVQKADRRDVPVAALYREQPAWGEWHSLREEPQQ